MQSISSEQDNGYWNPTPFGDSQQTCRSPVRFVVDERSNHTQARAAMLDHGFDELVEDETLIVQLGRLAQLEILSDGLD